MEPHNNSTKSSVVSAATSHNENKIDHLSDANYVDLTSDDYDAFGMGFISTQSMKRKYPISDPSMMGRQQNHNQQQQNQLSDSTSPVKVQRINSTFNNQHKIKKKQKLSQKDSSTNAGKNQLKNGPSSPTKGVLSDTNDESEEEEGTEQIEVKIAKTKLPKNNKYFCPKCFQQSFKWSKLSSHLNTEHNTELKGFPGSTHPLHMIHFESRKNKKKKKRLLQNNNSEQSHNSNGEESLKAAPPVVDEVKLPAANNVISYQAFGNGTSSTSLANISKNGKIDPPVSQNTNPLPSFGNPRFDFGRSNNGENPHSLHRTKSDTLMISKSATSSSLGGNSTTNMDETFGSEQNLSKRDNLAEKIREKANCPQRKRKAKPIVSILRKKRRFANYKSDRDETTLDESEKQNGTDQQTPSTSIVSKKNLLQSISKMVSKVHFAPDSDLAQIRLYEVTPSDQYYYGSSVPVPPEANNQKTQDPNLHSNQNVEIGFDHTIQSAAQESAEESDKSTYTYANKLTELAVHGSINDMITCLREGASARGTFTEKPIDKVKEQLEKLNNNFTNLSKSVASLSSSSLACNQAKERIIFIKQRIKQFEVKRTILKIFKEIEIIVELGRSMHPTFNSIERTDDHFKTKRNTCAKKIRDVCDWIHRFHKDTPRMNVDAAIEPVNVNMNYDGMTMLHSAVCIYAVDAIKSLRRLGAKNNIKCDKLGTVFDVAKSLRDEASSRGDKKFENAFNNILWDLD